MKYLALIRGINVGGNSIIKMAKLKELFLKSGFTEVASYIQSGNVIFTSTESGKDKISKKIEKSLYDHFGIVVRVIVLTYAELEKILDGVPSAWKSPKDLRCYIAFVREPVTAEDVFKEIIPNEGIDFVKKEKGVLYLSTLLSGITKSKFSRLSGKKIYQDITIRNYTTTRKLLELMK